MTHRVSISVLLMLLVSATLIGCSGQTAASQALDALPEPIESERQALVIEGRVVP